MDYDELDHLCVQTGDIKRMPKNVAKAFMEDLVPRYAVYAQQFLEKNGMPGRVGYSFSGAQLHMPLEYAFGKADGMVPGKYKRARFFGFEYEHLYICAVTETGDRGSGWYFMDKKSTDIKVQNKRFEEVMGYQMFSPMHATAEQQKDVQVLGEFFEFTGAVLLHALTQLKNKGLIAPSKMAQFDQVDERSWERMLSFSGAAKYVALLEQQLLSQVPMEKQTSTSSAQKAPKVRL